MHTSDLYEYCLQQHSRPSQVLVDWGLRVARVHHSLPCTPLASYQNSVHESAAHAVRLPAPGAFEPGRASAARAMGLTSCVGMLGATVTLFSCYRDPARARVRVRDVHKQCGSSVLIYRVNLFTQFVFSDCHVVPAVPLPIPASARTSPPRCRRATEIIEAGLNNHCQLCLRSHRPHPASASYVLKEQLYNAL